MPDDFDELVSDQGTETGLPDQSTVEDEEEQDLFGTDGDQSDDLDASPTTDDRDDADDGSVSGSFLTDADKALFFRDPDQGISNVETKANEFVRKQNRRFTSRMKEVATQRKQIAEQQKQFAEMAGKFQEMKERYPTLYREVEGFFTGKTPKEDAVSDEPRTVKDLLSAVEKIVDKKMGSLRSEYVSDRTSEAVDSLLNRAKNERLSEKRDDLIAVKTQHPEWNMRQVVGAVAPDILAEIVAKKPVRPGPAPLRPVNEQSRIRSTVKTPEDAFNAAVADVLNNPA